jgi:hypothetical protein
MSNLWDGSVGTSAILGETVYKNIMKETAHKMFNQGLRMCWGGCNPLSHPVCQQGSNDDLKLRDKSWLGTYDTRPYMTTATPTRQACSKENWPGHTFSRRHPWRLPVLKKALAEIDNLRLVLSLVFSDSYQDHWWVWGWMSGTRTMAPMIWGSTYYEQVGKCIMVPLGVSTSIPPYEGQQVQYWFGVEES